jgi:hypothetical protein
VKKLALVVGFVLLVTARCFAVAYTWRWFIAPLGVPVIGLGHAFGVSMFAHALIGHSSSKSNEEPRLDPDMADMADISDVYGKAIGYALSVPLAYAVYYWFVAT